MSLIQLPRTSDVKNGAVSVGSSLSDTSWSFRSSKACKAQFIRKSPRRRWYVVKSDGEDSEQCILKSAFSSIYIFFHRGLDVFELLSGTFLSLLYALQLVFCLEIGQSFPHLDVTPLYWNTFFKALRIIFPANKCFFIRDTELQFHDCVV